MQSARRRDFRAHHNCRMWTKNDWNQCLVIHKNTPDSQPKTWWC
jgi:hypothetical protein